MDRNQPLPTNMKKIEIDDFIYSINDEEKVAFIVKCDTLRRQIIIPCTIKYKSNEYVVKSILENAFIDSDRVKSVQFASGSQIQTIVWQQIFLLFSN